MAAVGEIGSGGRAVVGAAVFLLIGLAALQVRHAPRTRAVGQVRSHCRVHAEEIRLPVSGAEEIRPADPLLDVLVSIDGPVRVAGKALRDDEIDNLFRAAFQHDRRTGVVLRYERGVGHRRVVNLMERAKAGGLTRIAIGSIAGGG
jgi:biopolymer transport protein ExbD